MNNPNLRLKQNTTTQETVSQPSSNCFVAWDYRVDPKHSLKEYFNILNLSLLFVFMKNT